MRPAAWLPCRRCGCAYTAHEHLRDGLDCGPCGPAVCPRFKRPSTGGLLTRILGRL